MHLRMHDFVNSLGVLLYSVVWRKKKNTWTFNLLYERIWKFSIVCVLILSSLSCNLVMWYGSYKNLLNEIFCCFSQHCPVQSGNLHGCRMYDDLQNLLDMTSHDKPLYFIRAMQPKIHTPSVKDLREVVDWCIIEIICNIVYLCWSDFKCSIQ